MSDEGSKEGTLQTGIVTGVEEAEKKKIVDMFKRIEDPELQLDIWTLGLIYEVAVGDAGVHIKMTFTSPMCPFAPQIIAEVKSGIKGLGYSDPELEFIFDPPWEPSEEVKMLLGLA